MVNPIQNTSSPILIDVKTAAAISGLSQTTIRNLVGVPGAGVMMSGRLIKIHRRTFEQYLSTLAEKGACIGDCNVELNSGAKDGVV